MLPFLNYFFYILQQEQRSVTVFLRKKNTVNFYTALKYHIFNLGGEHFRSLSMYSVNDSFLHLQVEHTGNLVVSRCELNYRKGIDCVFQKLFDHNGKVGAKITHTQKIPPEIVLRFLSCCFVSQRPRITIIF